MKRKIARALIGLLALLAAGVGILVAVGIHRADKSYDVPLPPIDRATSPEAIARGEYIFRSTCADCHQGERVERAIGRPLTDWPPFVGRAWSANLTHDPDAGIGAMSDREIARVLRYGVLRDGHVSAV